MDNIEKIKFGTNSFDLVPDGVKLGKSGGSIIFQKGVMSFNDIKAILKVNGDITQIGLSGEPDWNRTDLIYAGRLTEQENYVVNTTNMQSDIESEIPETMIDVMIADFRTPNLIDEIEALKKENYAIKESLGTLLLNNLEEV